LVDVEPSNDPKHGGNFENEKLSPICGLEFIPKKEGFELQLRNEGRILKFYPLKILSYSMY